MWKGLSSNFKPSKSDHGFVYIITIENPETKKPNYYIGCKKFYKRIKRKPLKGKKRNRICYVESDWKTYTSSSKTLNEWINMGSSFEREVLKIVGSQWELNYFENLYIMNSHSMFRDDFLNGFAGFRQNEPPKSLQNKFKRGEIDFTLPKSILNLV